MDCDTGFYNFIAEKRVQQNNQLPSSLQFKIPANSGCLALAMTAETLFSNWLLEYVY
jgi:hypothetical protein